MKKITKNPGFILRLYAIVIIISGLTAIPIAKELMLMKNLLPTETNIGNWILYVANSYSNLMETTPYVAYGTDWLAFAHIIIGVLFFAAAKNPEKNIIVVRFGIFSCLAIIPFTLIAGFARNIPFYWQCIDMSFGIFGVLPLLYVNKTIQNKS